MDPTCSYNMENSICMLNLFSHFYRAYCSSISWVMTDNRKIQSYNKKKKYSMQSNNLINQHTKITCSKCWKGVWFSLGQPLSHDNVMWICVMKYKTMLLQTKTTKNSQWHQLLSAVADPGEGHYYYFQTKLRPKESKNTF